MHTNTFREVLIFLATIMCVFLTLYTNYSSFKFLNQTYSTLKIPLNLPQSQSYHQNKRFTLLPITIDSGYFFNLPILTLAWRRIGIEPIYLVVHSSNSDFKSSNNKTINWLVQLKSHLVFIRSMPFYEEITNELATGLAGVIGENLISEEDFVMTGDVSLYPIDLKYFNRGHGDEIIAWECVENSSMKNFSKFGKVGMKKWQWQKVMKIKKNGLDKEKIVLKLLENFKELARHEQYHQMKGEILSISIQKYVNEDNKTALIKVKRNFVLEKRLNISEAIVNDQNSLKGVIDVVAPFGDLAAFESWRILEKFFYFIFSPEECEFLDQYFRNYF